MTTNIINCETRGGVGISQHITLAVLSSCSLKTLISPISKSSGSCLPKRVAVRKSPFKKAQSWKQDFSLLMDLCKLFLSSDPSHEGWQICVLWSPGPWLVQVGPGEPDMGCVCVGPSCPSFPPVPSTCSFSYGVCFWFFQWVCGINPGKSMQ